jgi:hypothetical protein
MTVCKPVIRDPRVITALVHIAAVVNLGCVRVMCNLRLKVQTEKAPA